MKMLKKEVTEIEENITETIYTYKEGEIIVTINSEEGISNHDVYPFDDEDANAWLETTTLTKAKKLLKNYRSV
tara:strand:- start:9248 stop:9466 length:219 start_codon:yes stop_codon:yes gene_type:complete